MWELLDEGGTAVPPQGTALPHKGGLLSQRWLAWVLAGVGLAAAVGLGYFAFRPAEAPRNLKLSLLLPEGAVFNPIYSLPAVSPDGRRLAVPLTVSGKTELWVRELDSLSARPLTGTEGAELPFWSPDSRWIGFFTGGKLKKIDVTGGPASTLCDASSAPRGGTWNRNDVIVFAPTNNGGLSRCPAEGGTLTPVTNPDLTVERSHRYPWFLPDGRHFLYIAVMADLEKRAIYAGDLDAKDDAKARVRVLAGDSNAVYSPPGYLLFVRERTLMAQPFDAGKLQLTGGAVPVAEEVDYIANNNQGRFAVSQNGVLAYTSGAAGGNQQQLTWFDQTGKSAGNLGKPGDMNWPAISPDGKSVAVDRRDPQTGFLDIWLYDLVHGNESRFTFGPLTNQWPVWSGDGGHIAFSSSRGGRSEIYQRATSGTAQDEFVAKADVNMRADDWSHDGRYLLESHQATPKTGCCIWVLPLFEKKEAIPYLVSEFAEQYARLSPDGRWVAYQSLETKRNEIYVQTFPMKGGKWQVSINGGTRPAWSRDGKELYFIGEDQKMMAAPIKAGETFEHGTPKALFDVRMLTDRRFDVSKDGRFLIPTSAEQAGSVPITVVNNWQAGLKK